MNNKSGTDLFGARIDGEPTAAEIRLNYEVLAALAREAGRSRKEHWRQVEAIVALVDGVDRGLPLNG